MKTRVVNLRDERCDIYIGRGRNSDWGNPFSHIDSPLVRWLVPTRTDAITQHREWLINERPDLIARLHELEGKRLGCYCKPLDCHGDNYVDLIEIYLHGINK